MSAQTYFDDGETQANLIPDVGVVSIRQDDETVRMTAEGAVLMAFHTLFHLAPELLDAGVEEGVVGGHLMAVGLRNGGTLLLQIQEAKPCSAP